MITKLLVLAFGAFLPSSSAGAVERITPPAAKPQVLAQAAASPPAMGGQPAPAQSQHSEPQQNVYLQDPLAVARINAQIEALMAPPNGGFAVQYYAKPAPLQNGQQPPIPPGAVFRDDRGRPEKYVIARPGDAVYATLDRAFNSDDPPAPIFATIHDVDNAGVQGPLDGVRMVGNIVYSASQGSIQFSGGYLPDGRGLQVKAIAVSEDSGRAGAAKNVDSHDLTRPATISGPAGMGLGVVFLEPVAVPRDVLFPR